MKEPDVLEGERWKNVLGYEGLYEVSNLGRVRRVFERGYRYLKPSVNLSRGGKQEGIGVHILISEAFQGEALFKRRSPRINQPKENAWSTIFGETKKEEKKA